MQVKVLKVFT